MADDPLPPGLPSKLYFRIGEVAGLVGVEPHVLRYWETEFAVSPHRSSSGQRLYRKQEIARFLRIRRLLHTQGFTIAGARKVLARRSEGDAGSTVDLDKLRDALERLGRLRRDLAALRSDLSTSLARPPGGG